MTRTFLQRIATGTPAHEVHHAFIDFGERMLRDDRARVLFRRMAEKCQIEKRYSCLSAGLDGVLPEQVDARDLFQLGAFPTTQQRMRLFERLAKPLLRSVLDRLCVTEVERSTIQHVIVTCCTGFYAPGLDFDAVDLLGLPASTDRTFVGFMGCYAALNGLKLARHIVRSDPGKRVLMVNLELCTLHLQETQDLEQALSYLIFGDGCAASLIGSDAIGFELDDFSSISIPDTRDLITWRVGDQGFDMHLSGQVPAKIATGLKRVASALPGADETALWAIHPGGRSVLDSVETSLGLDPQALATSRKILNDFGNLSSATVMFVLASMLKEAHAGERGCAMSFGPGLTAETMRFHGV